MARLFALSLFLAWFEGLADYATSIDVRRVPVVEDATGGSTFSRTLTTGQTSSNTISASLSASVSASLSAGAASATSEYGAEMSASATYFSESRQETAFSYAGEGRPFYIYQTVLTVHSSNGQVFTSRAHWEIFHTRQPLIHTEVTPVADQTHNMHGHRVQMHQPEERRGWYDCRDVSQDVCSALNRNNGCRTVDDYTCPGGQKPFKWGGAAYFGGWTLPEGLCVTFYRHWGRCDPSNIMSSRVCAQHGSRTYYHWDYNDRVCSWRFELMDGYTCDSLGNINLAANESVVVSNADGAGEEVAQSQCPGCHSDNDELAQMPSSALSTMQAAAFIVCSFVMGVAFTLAVVRKSRKTSADDYHQVVA